MQLYIRKKQAIIISSIVAIVAFATSKIYQYATAPSEPKDCSYLYPRNIDQVKSNTITLNSTKDSLDFKQKGGVSNDASCLNQTSVYGVVKISSVEDIKNTLQFARENKLKVTSAGQQHSMGGQSFVQNGLVMDMKSYNKLKLNKEDKVLNVQSGAVWSDIQQFLDKEGLAVSAMQSINVFTVGGTLSVNAHGIAHIPGQIAPTVNAMRVMLSNGEIITASPTENVELFKSVLGGYGLFGVILDVDLQVVDNEMYMWDREIITYKDFPEYYKNNIQNNDNIGLIYGRLSVSPTSYLKEMIVNKYVKVRFEGSKPELQISEHDWINRLVINFSKTGGMGRWVRWLLEKNVEPKIHICSRNQAMSQKDVCIVTRNQEMYSSMGYLKNKLNDTDILQEYFIPRDKMELFVDGLRKVVKENNANLLNVTVRVVNKDDITSLPYAKEDAFAFVLYFNQKFNDNESRLLQKTTTDLIDVATSVGGTYYLPYQLYYSSEQLSRAYPEVNIFFATKKKYDPLELFTNKFYEKYGN